MQGEFGVFVVCSGRVGGKAERGPGRSARRRYAPLEMPYSVPKHALPSASFKSFRTKTGNLPYTLGTLDYPEAQHIPGVSRPLRVATGGFS